MDLKKSTHPVLAYTVRQCRACRKILRFPILDWTDVLAYSYPHCGQPSEYLETVGTHEDQ
jgi:hypothetical protein